MEKDIDYQPHAILNLLWIEIRDIHGGN